MGLKIMIKVVALAVVVLLLLQGVSHALTYEQKVLVGLEGVHVLVEKIDRQAERLGLTEAQIKTDVELKLRKTGVRVLTREETVKTPGSPVLYVEVKTKVGQPPNLVTCSSRVTLKEEVTLASGGETYGAIWETDNWGTVGKNNIRQIREVVGDLVDKFINDYLAANPKK